MANFVTISPNMGMPIPIPGVDPGPDWADNIVACLGILDQHGHVTNQGVPIVPAAININSDLPFNGNNIKLLKAVIFTSQSVPIPAIAPYLGCVYVSGNELFYNDEAGNEVQITNNGSVNSGAGAITGLPSGTASASYSSSSQTFVWQSATNTPANMDFASATFRNLVANSFGLTLNPPTLGSDIQETLPPANSTGQTVFLTYDPSNNMGIGPSITSGVLTPPGSITMYGGTSAPAGYFICDGTAYSRTTYATLFAVIGTAYGYGDGTTTFNVPDFRGIFPRGVDNGAGNDPDTSSRTAANPGGNTGDNVGSIQGYQIQSHTHVGNVGGGFDTTSPTYVSIASAVFTASEGVAINDTGGNETRPINLYVNFIIKT